MAGKLSPESYTSGFFVTVFLLVGVGGFIHSLIDYTIAFSIAQKIGWKFKFPVYLAAHKQK
jgi:niacin transporter